MALPRSNTGQNCVSVSAIAGGHLTLPEWAFIEPCDSNAKRTVPSLSFLVEHPTPQKLFDETISPERRRDGPLRILFDLGLRGDLEKYPVPIQPHIKKRQPMHSRPSVSEVLEVEGLTPKDVDVVIFSHVHYDHHGDPEDFPDSRFLVGRGALDVLEKGLPGRGSHSHFDPDLFKDLNATELPSVDSTESSVHEPLWNPLGPFDAALDLFQDSSVYVIDAPGHLPGHINLLCRTGEHEWVYLAGDSYHDRRILTGERNIGTWSDDSGGTFCIHMDKEAAANNIERIRTVMREAEGSDYTVEVIAAHDIDWYEKAKENGRLFPQSL